MVYYPPWMLFLENINFYSKVFLYWTKWRGWRRCNVWGWGESREILHDFCKQNQEQRNFYAITVFRRRHISFVCPSPFPHLWLRIVLGAFSLTILYLNIQFLNIQNVRFTEQIAALPTRIY